MQKRQVPLDGLRLLLWGAILLLMILVGVLILDGRDANVTYQGAVLVSAQTGGAAA